MKNPIVKLRLEEDELELYKNIIIQSIIARVEKSKAEGGVVAFSGGIDSSLVLVLSQMALGNKVLALIMPEKGITPDEDTKDAIKLCNRLGIAYKVIEINQFVKNFSSLVEELGNGKEKILYTVANVKPRVRMVINYIHANHLNRIVIGTSNKTELLLGYGTKFGDMAADIYPIGDLYKTQVWQLAEYVGIPTEIIKKVPSAGLWKGQTDEEELGHTYHEIDRVLFALVELELSVRETSLLLGYPEEAILDIFERVLKSEHKRKPPTITRLSKMCLDKDWRYPVERY